jgi:hypothetical protein
MLALLLICKTAAGRGLSLGRMAGLGIVRYVPGAPNYLGPAGVPLRHLGEVLDPGLHASCVTPFSLKLQRKALGKRVALLACILLTGCTASVGALSIRQVDLGIVTSST